MHKSNSFRANGVSALSRLCIEPVAQSVKVDDWDDDDEEEAEEEEDYQDDEEDQAELEFAVGRMYLGWIMVLFICKK